MKRFMVIVLDGFGIGAMEDVPALRPRDTGANTALHIYQSLPGLRLPALEGLGLGNALRAASPEFFQSAGDSAALPAPVKRCCVGFHRLAHFGADTFWGHQELMGTKPLKGESGPIAPRHPAIRDALIKNGHHVRFYSDPANLLSGVLVVDEAVTVGDNLETDLGDNYNVTAALDHISFDKVREIGAVVRSLVRSSRVIVFGGRGVDLSDILSAYERSGPFAGVSAPRSGVYREGYQVVHLGFGVKAETQVPAKLETAGISTVLIGKVADIVENRGGKSIPGVDTKEVLEKGAAALDDLDEGYICINVQETDLAGHREDPALYGDRLAAADRGIGAIVEKLGEEDLLVITADHGNDPTIGHPQHTREKTPILICGKKVLPGYIGGRGSLADTGATVCEFFNAPFPEAGASYLKTIPGV
jgi:phosphopentomutase